MPPLSIRLPSPLSDPFSTIAHVSARCALGEFGCGGFTLPGGASSYPTANRRLLAGLNTGRVATNRLATADRCLLCSEILQRALSPSAANRSLAPAVLNSPIAARHAGSVSSCCFNAFLLKLQSPSDSNCSSGVLPCPASGRIYRAKPLRDPPKPWRPPISGRPR